MRRTTLIIQGNFKKFLVSEMKRCLFWSKNFRVLSVFFLIVIFRKLFEDPSHLVKWFSEMSSYKHPLGSWAGRVPPSWGLRRSSGICISKTLPGDICAGLQTLVWGSWEVEEDAYETLKDSKIWAAVKSELAYFQRSQPTWTGNLCEHPGLCKPLLRGWAWTS